VAAPYFEAADSLVAGVYPLPLRSVRLDTDALAAAAVTPSNNGGVDEGGGGNGGGSSGGVHDVNNANVENVENFFRAPTFSAFAVSGRVAVVGLCKKLNPVDP
jgi:hypothetical protein